MENTVRVGNKNYSLEEFSRGLISNCDLSEADSSKVQQYLKRISGGDENNQKWSSKIKQKGFIQTALNNWEMKICRLTLFALAAFFSQVTQAMLEKRDMSGNQIIDYPIEWTNSLNDFFWQNQTITNSIIIFCSFFMDFFTMVLPYLVVFGKDKHPNRVVLSVAFFFVLRQFFQTLIVLPTPKGYLWRYPGFPSLVVPYNPANDFYFSGHIGFLVVTARELAKRRYWKLFIGCLIAIIVNSMMIIVTRIHYSIDIIDAIFVAWFAVDMAERFSPLVDQWFHSIVLYMYNKKKSQ